MEWLALKPNLKEDYASAVLVAAVLMLVPTYSVFKSVHEVPMSKAEMTVDPADSNSVGVNVVEAILMKGNGRSDPNEIVLHLKGQPVVYRLNGSYATEKGETIYEGEETHTGFNSIGTALNEIRLIQEKRNGNHLPVHWEITVTGTRGEKVILDGYPTPVNSG